jgi:hypothetical protein
MVECPLYSSSSSWSSEEDCLNRPVGSLRVDDALHPEVDAGCWEAAVDDLRPLLRVAGGVYTFEEVDLES